MLSALRYVTFALTFSVILTIYLTILTVTEENYKNVTYRNGDKVKSIVAYSLLKKLELEGEKIYCKNFLENITIREEVEFSKLNGGRNVRKSTWVKIPETKFYAYSVHLDRRLDPYHYLRIIGMVEGKFTYCNLPC